VIVPAYNAAKLIRPALTSALYQSAGDLEVIVVDDGSSDQTADVAEEFAARDPRVRLVRHELTRGVAAARNTAITHARGEWIAPLDADDAFVATRIETLLKLAGEAQAD